jgi:hypothetical protein
MTGVVVIRAPVRGPSFADDTINALQSAQCQPVIEPDPNVVASEAEPKPESPLPSIIRGGSGIRRPVRPAPTQIR